MNNNLEVESDRVLLVEGQGEQKLFEKLLELQKVCHIQVIDAAGKSRIRGMLGAVISSALTNSIDLKSIGVVRDADLNANSAFTSVRDAIDTNDLLAPSHPEVLAAGDPKTAILILPGRGNRGALEDVCLNSISDLPVGECVERYIQCLEANGVMESSNKGKTGVHAFLASKSDPTSDVGRGAVHGYWNLESEAFDILKNFITLIERA